MSNGTAADTDTAADEADGFIGASFSQGAVSSSTAVDAEAKGGEEVQRGAAAEKGAGMADDMSTLHVAALVVTAVGADDILGENETLLFGISLMSSWANTDPLSVVNCTCLPILFFQLV